MPGDGFALTVTIGGQIEFVDAFEQALQLADGALLFRADDVQRFEVRIDVDSEPGPGLGFELRGHVGRGSWQVADMPPRGLDDISGAEVTGEFARLRRRLDNDKSPEAPISTAAAWASGVHTVRVSQLRLRSISYPGPPWRDHPAGRMTGRHLKFR